MSAADYLVIPKNQQRRMNYFKHVRDDAGVDEHTVFLHYCAKLRPDQQCDILEDLVSQLNIPIAEEEL